MSPKDVMRQNMDLSDMIVQAYLGDLSDSDILVRPVPGMNHIAWQLGHLLVSERNSIETLAPGTCPPLPAGFEIAHGKDGAKSDEPSKFHPVEAYRGLMKAQRAATLRYLEQVPDAELDHADPEKLPPYAPTVGALLNMIGAHVVMHTGQFVAVRRLLNKPVTI